MFARDPDNTRRVQNIVLTNSDSFDNHRYALAAADARGRKTITT